MPHDRKNHKLHPGDVVMIPCVVLGIDKHAEYINLALESVEGRYPDGKKEMFLVNARQTELIEAVGHSDAEIDVEKAMIDSGVLQHEGSGLKKGDSGTMAKRVAPLPDEESMHQ